MMVASPVAAVIVVVVVAALLVFADTERDVVTGARRVFRLSSFPGHDAERWHAAQFTCKFDLCCTNRHHCIFVVH